MARYTCPDCQIESRDVRTQAEADELLGTHQTYFCRPVRPTVQRVADRHQAAPAVTR